jgi:uncharacterized protein (DUF2267 family)
MSATGLEVFDSTLQKTHIWLNDISETLGEDRQTAWMVLGAVLRAIRDRLTVELSAHLGAQLPLLIRGAYYDQFNPSIQPLAYRSLDEFHAEITTRMRIGKPIEPAEAAEAVFGVLTRHITPEQVAKVRQSLPEEVRSQWPIAMPAH